MLYAAARPLTLIAVKLVRVLSDKREIIVKFFVYNFIVLSMIGGGVYVSINDWGAVFMYMKDKGTRITLRLNDKQFSYVKNSADILGVSPSEFLRLVINQTMNMDKESNRRANENADIFDIL